MSMGEKAVILIRLDAEPGRALQVPELAAHMGLCGLAHRVVVARILELEAEGYVLSQRDAAGDVVGVRLAASAVQMLARTSAPGAARWRHA